MNKKICLIFIVVLLATSVLAAEIDLLEFYGPGDIISGRISMSLIETSADSNFTAVIDSTRSSIRLIDFLNNASADYLCTPDDCSYTFTASSPSLVKNITNEYVSLLINSGKNVQISQLMFNINGSWTIKSCGFIPVKMDLLDDGTIDWQYMEPDEEFCSELVPSWTYDKNIAEASYNIISEPYCEKVELEAGKRFKLGADIIKGRIPVNLFMSISDGTNTEECKLNNENGLQTCIVNFTVPEKGFYYICIRSDSDDSDTMIKGETKTPNCGMFGFRVFDCNESSVDYALYSQPSYFKPFSEKIIFDTFEFQEFAFQELENYVQEYIDKKYNSDCSSGCIIPIRFISDQRIELSNLTLKYTSNLGARTERYFYSAEKKAAKINMSEQNLILDAAGFRLPSAYGIYTLKIMLNDKVLGEKKIEVAKVPVIKSIFPLMIPAATSIIFTAKVESPKGNSIEVYEWDFGDGMQETTYVNYVSHIYGIGKYILTLKVTDSEGLSSQKSFPIIVESPKDIVNFTIERKKANLDSLKNEIKKIQAWYMDLVKETIDLVKIEAKLAEFQLEIKKPDADYVALKLALDELFVPFKISEEKIEALVHSKPDANILARLENAEIQEKEKINEKIKMWNDANIDMRAFYIIKTAVEDTESKNLATEYRLEVKSKSDISFNDIYLVIASPAKIVFKKNYTEYSQQKVDSATAFVIDITKEAKIIEFAVIGNHSVDEFGIFASPSLKELSVEEAICGDGHCDKQKGESYEICPADCKKPYGKAVMWIVIVTIIIGLGIFAIWKYYAVLYDKRLREKLFKPIEDFYKISFFISSEMNQGKSEKEIRNELEKVGWKKSQIDYAIEKVKMQRKALQKKVLIAFIQRELAAKKSEEEIKKKLKESGWSSSLINYAFKKAIKK
ncbi:MAG: PKD domain-containing protein [Candidatus Pacearchaeota archaeon]